MGASQLGQLSEQLLFLQFMCLYMYIVYSRILFMNGLNTHLDLCMVARDKLAELLTTLEYNYN